LKAVVAAAALILLAGCAERQTPPGPVTPPPPPGQPPAPPPPTTVGAGMFGIKGDITQGALVQGVAPTGTSLLMLDGKPVRFAPDGHFIIAFDRDQGPNALLEARIADGRLLRLPLTIGPRAWDISSLPTLQRGTSPSPEFQRIRSAEVAQITAAKAMNSPSEGWRQTFRWPATGRISTLFGSQRIYAGVPGSYHGGIDIAKYADGPAIAGTPARSPADGVVVLATDHPFSLEGNLVLIDHGMGLISALMHLSKVEVTVGQQVRQGDEIGLVGATGRVTGPHLHWGMTWGTARIDPLLLAGPMPNR